jgi:hypothetical protein
MKISITYWHFLIALLICIGESSKYEAIYGKLNDQKEQNSVSKNKQSQKYEQPNNEAETTKEDIVDDINLFTSTPIYGEDVSEPIENPTISKHSTIYPTQTSHTSNQRVSLHEKLYPRKDLTTDQQAEKTEKIEDPPPFQNQTKTSNKTSSNEHLTKLILSFGLAVIGKLSLF